MSVILTALLVSTGCTQKNDAGGDTIVVDTMLTDSVDSVSMIVDETPMPVAADELFDDFFFNYAASRKVQYERTLFPLSVTEYGKEKNIEKGQWKIEHFFMKQGYYTIILSSQKGLNLMKDTKVGDVTVERISMDKGVVKRWHFLRENGLWHLNDIATISLRQHYDAGFLTFYQHFVTDTEFQQQSLAETVTFTGPDPEDDFSTMTGEIMPEQWPMFVPWLPSGTIYNIVYGKDVVASSSTRYFLIRGIANGLQTDIVFVRNGKSWQLKKITT